MVICIHSLGLVNDALTTGDEEARVTNAVMTIVYGGVPLFVMLSGALLLGKEEPISAFFRKRMGRLLWPFLFRSVVVCAIQYWQEDGRSLSGYATSLFTGLVTGGVHGIYWYVYMIIGLYLVTPFLRKIVHHSDKGYLYYLIGLLLSIITVSKYFPDVELFSRWNSANVEMLAYFVIGYAIVEYFKTCEWSVKVVFGWLHSAVLAARRIGVFPMDYSAAGYDALYQLVLPVSDGQTAYEATSGGVKLPI